MHRYTTADLRRYAEDVERAVTTPGVESDPEGRQLEINIDDPLYRVLFGIYAWILGEFAEVREQLDRIEARTNTPLYAVNFDPTTSAAPFNLNTLTYEGETHGN